MFVCTGVSVHRGHAPHLTAGPRYQDVSPGEGRARASGQYEKTTKLEARTNKIESSGHLKMDRRTDPKLRQ